MRHRSGRRRRLLFRLGTFRKFQTAPRRNGAWNDTRHTGMNGSPCAEIQYKRGYAMRSIRAQGQEREVCETSAPLHNCGALTECERGPAELEPTSPVTALIGTWNFLSLNNVPPCACSTHWLRRESHEEAFHFQERCFCSGSSFCAASRPTLRRSLHWKT